METQRLVRISMLALRGPFLRLSVVAVSIAIVLSLFAALASNYDWGNRQGKGRYELSVDVIMLAKPESEE